jgi:hypothetical protein
MLSLAGSPQVSAPLEPIVADGLTKRDHDGWFSISGRHRDGLQVEIPLMTACVWPQMMTADAKSLSQANAYTIRDNAHT